MEIFVDGDACPVKDETYVVATRYGLPTVVVSNAPLYVPQDLGVRLVLVGREPDAADDWIAEHIGKGDVAVTADIALAARCLEVGAQVLGTNGRIFDVDSIGDRLAMRDLKAGLRDAGILSGGPPALSERDRSLFMSKLDLLVQRGLRAAGAL